MLYSKNSNYIHWFRVLCLFLSIHCHNFLKFSMKLCKSSTRILIAPKKYTHTENIYKKWKLKYYYGYVLFHVIQVVKCNFDIQFLDV